MAAQTIDTEQLQEAIDVSGVTGTDVLVAFGILAATIVAATVTRRIIIRVLRPLSVPEYVGPLLGRIVFYIVLIVGIAIALERVGISIGPLLFSAGFILIIAAFIARPLLENFGAGLLLEARAPFQVGEQISSQGYEGTVQEINARSVVVLSTSGETVHLPNVSVLREPLVNLTALGRRRTTLEVGLDYETPLAEARSVVLDAVTGLDGVLMEPLPEAYVHQFGDSTINLLVRFWHEPEIIQSWITGNEVALAIKGALDEAGMTIAFPQRVLWWGEGAGHIDDPGAVTSG